MRLCDLDEIKIRVERQYKDCHGYSGNKKAIYREAILAVMSILHSAKTIDAVPVVRCRECKFGTHFGDMEDEWIRCMNLHGNPLMPFDGFCSYGERKEVLTDVEWSVL